ncbi:hypothetical protein [Paracoccus sp. DMF]|uniref:hypothetical protein n=1 Tax=Paracoccus sp. DMF TaxID=400837 RepID=UPI00110219C4|nr:hypothetical protein [Paracoccus sp. DMF]MCV2448373.1 hypothetical protein [Paracoccus sp. DMF]
MSAAFSMIATVTANSLVIAFCISIIAIFRAEGQRRLPAAARGPPGNDPQAVAEAGETTPELGPIAASAGPSIVELDAPRLERVGADAERTPQDAPDGLPAAAGPQGDVPDRNALAGEERTAAFTCSRRVKPSYSNRSAEGTRAERAATGDYPTAWSVD